MKLISLLIVLVVIAYLISSQLNTESSSQRVKGAVSEHEIDLPKVPTSPNELKAFETDVNTFIQDTSSQPKDQLESALEQ